MRVRVVESGHGETSVQVDYVRVRTDPRAHVVVGANCNNFFALNRDGLCMSQRGNGINIAVDERQGGGRFRGVLVWRHSPPLLSERAMQCGWRSKEYSGQGKQNRHARDD